MIMRTRGHGYLLMESVVGLSILSAMVVCLAVSTHQYARGVNAMADHRAAHRSAECVLTELQTGRPASLDIPQMQVELSAAAKPPTPTPDGFVWAVVSVEYRQKRARLVGLAPRDAFDQTLGERGQGAR